MVSALGAQAILLQSLHSAFSVFLLHFWSLLNLLGSEPLGYISSSWCSELTCRKVASKRQVCHHCGSSIQGTSTAHQIFRASLDHKPVEKHIVRAWRPLFVKGWHGIPRRPVRSHRNFWSPAIFTSNWSFFGTRFLSSLFVKAQIDN